MTTKLFRSGNHSRVSIPAPKKLISTSEPAQRMSLQYAQDVLNMLPGKEGQLDKRFGVTQQTMTGIAATEKIIKMTYRSETDGTFKLLAYTDAGKIYHSDTSLTTWTSLKTGLDTTGTPRFCHFNQNVIICNGIDNNMVYDGSTVADLEEYVEDTLASSETKVDTDTFTLTPGTGRENNDYPIGRGVRITMDSGATIVTSTVLTSSYNSGTDTTTVDLSTNVLTGTTIDKIEYLDKPPAFSFIFPAHDRLWALSGGELKAQQFRNNAQRMYLYYTQFTNNENGWFNSSTQEVPFINLADKHVINDELVGIGLMRDYLIIFGRYASQLWTGTIPITGGDFSWARTVQVGCVNGDMILSLDQDLLFMSPDGARNFSRVLQTDDIEQGQEIASDVQEMIRNQLSKIEVDDSKYKDVRAFRYGRGGFYGFKFPDECHIYPIKKRSQGWVRFTGVFSGALAYTNPTDGRLWIAKDNVLYYYNDEDEVYDDNGDAIPTNWWTPEFQAKGGHRWANRYIEIETEAGDDMDIEIHRYKDNTVCAKKIYSIANLERSAYWDEAFWDVDFWDCDTDFGYPRIEEKYISFSTSYALKTNNTKGPLSLVALNLYGKAET